LTMRMRMENLRGGRGPATRKSTKSGAEKTKGRYRLGANVRGERNFGEI